ncbi:hypothetical protein ACJIZ3_018917 [Penstemon smallii]|uniref:Uncharacterized protein n=1 Tax=Penstemon smallii TaxID=265156 RepID=A0ABD3T080_9LAMI
MSSTIKKANMIKQIVRLRHFVQLWKNKSLALRRSTPSGSVAVYVGTERRRFVIPTRFLNLPVFVDLLNQAEEEFGFQRTGGLVLPCKPGFFKEILRFLEEDEERFRGLGLEEFLNLVGFDQFNKFSENCHAFTTPLLPKTRV